jgi:hypothetical protein
MIGIQLNKAIRVARGQGARLFELRATADLARFWRDGGRCAEAHALLAPIYGWFTEGFGMPDLREARAAREPLLISMSKASFINDPAHSRSRAEEMRAVAEETCEPETKARMLRFAAEYDKLAKRAEERSAQHRERQKASR